MDQHEKQLWSRSGYPLQSFSEHSLQVPPLTSTPTGGDNQLSFQMSHGPRVAEVSIPSNQGVTDDSLVRTVTKTLRRTSRSRQLREIASEKSEQASPSPEPSTLPVVTEAALLPIMPTNNKHHATGSSADLWKRQMYPVQLVAGDSTSQDPSKLPPQRNPTLTNREIVSLTGKVEESSTSGALQNGINGLDALPLSPPSSDEGPENFTEPETHQTLEETRVNGPVSHWHRQTYPSQMAASKANIQDSLLPSPSPKAEQRQRIDRPTSQVLERKQATVRSKTFRREVYPLQSPASIANFQYTPRTSPSEVERISENANRKPSHIVPEQNHVPKRTHPFRRQAYPLQQQVSISAIQFPPSPPPDTSTGLDGKERSSARDKGPATAVSEHWRRQVYPLQSPENVLPLQQLPTPHPLEAEVRKDHAPRPIHLPKHIQAGKDAEKHDPTGRTIIVCLDGTGDKFDNDNSNIVHLISALKKDDARQVSYYQAGIGTYSSRGLSGGFSAALDMAVGSELGLHVRDAYHFLMHTYKEGDKICIFGFSRGAYTARCLAGMIHKVGLLPPRNIQQIPFAYEFYVNDTKEGWNESEKFKETFCIDVCVYFIGCFDSVASVGFIPRQLPLSSTPTQKARYFRHAMALDERRAKFKVCRHQDKDWDDIEKPSSLTNGKPRRTASNVPETLPKYEAQDHGLPRYSPHVKYGDNYHPNVTDHEYQRLTDHEAKFDTDVLEVWFVGAHADVGGGAVPNDERHKLAQIPLRWMVRQAFECDTGIIFKTKKLAEFGLDVHTLWPKYCRLSAPDRGPPPSLLEKYKSLPPRSVRRSKLVPIDKFEKGERFYHLKSHTDEDWTPEQIEDFYDAVAPLNDQLVQALSWWILEVWPVEYGVPVAPGRVSTATGMNLGRYREIGDFQPNLHWTALHRARQLGYRIQARTAPSTKWQVAV